MAASAPVLRYILPRWAKRTGRAIQRRLWDWPMVNLGWRPAHTIPLTPVFFQGDYGYDEEPEIKSALEIVHTHSTASLERLATLWLQVRYLDRYRIEGDLVECGVWKGGAAAMMALAHLRSGQPRRPLQLFDSFQGLPEPKAEFDGARVLNYANGNGVLRPIGMLEASVADCEQLLFERVGYPRNLVHFHAGWFQDTLPRDAGSAGDIALLRVAADWYDSTRLALQHLYSKVVRKGVVVIADYGHFQGVRRAVDEFLASLAEPIMLHHIDADGRYWIKP